MGSDLHGVMRKFKAAVDEGIFAEYAIVATTANSETDEVYVTLPNSEDPDEQIQVHHWRRQVTIVGGAAQWKYPEREDEALVIYMDTGELWLVW